MNSKTKSTLFLVLLTITLIICSTLVLTISINKSEENITYAEWTGQGTGTENDPYLIGTKAQLEKFRDIVNGSNGETKNVNACAKLTANIDLDNAWTPIGTNTEGNMYNGTFNGGGYQIQSSYNGSGEYAIFKCIGTDGVVKHLVSTGTITVTGSLQQAGGIALYNFGQILNCANKATITATNSYSTAGGIVNGNGGTIDRCHNEGYIKTHRYAGGIAAGDTSGTITNCYNVGKIETTENHAAGIVAQAHASLVEYCFSKAEIIPQDIHSGAIASEVFQNTNINHCRHPEDQTVYDVNKMNQSVQVGNDVFPLSDSEFKDKYEFSTWDFVSVWQIKPGADYPTLIDNYNLYIGNDTVTPFDLTGEGWSFNPSTYTLTLDNFSYSGDPAEHYNAKAALNYGGTQTLTIEVKNTCSLETTSLDGFYTAGIYSENASLIFKGDGYLTVKTIGNAHNQNYGIFAFPGNQNDITIQSGHITVECGPAPTSYSYAVNAYNLTMSGGELTAKAGASEYNCGVAVMKDLSVGASKLTAYGAVSTATNAGTYGIYVGGNLTMTNGTIDAKGGDSTYHSDGIFVVHNITITQGDFSAKGGESPNSYGLEGYLDYNSVMTTSKEVASVLCIGKTAAIKDLDVHNAGPGCAWVDDSQPDNFVELPINAGKELSAYKRIRFAPSSSDEPNPDQTPDDDPTPTPSPDGKRIDPDNGVTIETSDGTKIPEDITLKVVVKTEVTAKEGKIDPAKVQEKISSKEKIAKVYDVKLIRIIGENEEEIQPSDIKEGMTIKVQITLPKGVNANGLRILHVHSNGTIDEIDNVNVVDGVATIEVSSFSEFVLVTPASHGFCVGWVVFIFVILELLATCLYVIIRYGFFKELVAKCKLDCLYDKLDLMTFIGLCVAGGIFLFAFIALCCHQCALTIIMFILALIICCAFTYFFLKDKGFIDKWIKQCKEYLDKKKVKDEVKDEPQPKVEEQKEDSKAEEAVAKTEAEAEAEYESEKDDTLEEIEAKEKAHEALTLKDSLVLAKATTSSHKFTKKYVADYLRTKDIVEVNERENYTRTGLPLADTHYVDGKEGKKCFVYVYETEGSIILLAKMDSKYAEKLQEKHSQINLSAFPKQKNTWYSLIIDDTYTKEEFEGILDELIGEVKEDAGMSLKESIALAKASTSHSFSKKYVCDYLKDKPNVEVNTRENYTKTGLPLADTHYVEKDGKKICFAYIYEIEGSIILLGKMKSKCANALKKKHPNVTLSAFPKQADTWYSLIIDDTYTKEDFDKIIDDIIEQA